MRGAVCRGQVSTLAPVFATATLAIITILGYEYLGLAGLALGGVAGLLAAIVVFGLQRSHEEKNRA